MSYDLMFKAPPGMEVRKKDFLAYFAGRPNYQTGEGQAVYHNEDTGVYFIFDEPEDGVVAFNLNYLRPHVFGLEAAAELEQFVEAFAALVEDPQGEAEDGVFTREAFLRGWNNGNAFAYGAMLKEQTQPIHTWPAQRIEEVWGWNYKRFLAQEELGEDIFVPTVFVIEVDGKLLSVVVWPPGCPILLPAVDAVLLPVNQDDPESQDMALVRWYELEGLVAPYQEKHGQRGLTAFRLAFEEWPPDIAEFLRRQRSRVENFNGVAMDHILDQELVSSSRGPRAS